MEEQENVYKQQQATYGNSEQEFSHNSHEKIPVSSQSYKLQRMLFAVISCVCVVLIYIIMQQQSIVQESANAIQYDHTWTYIGFAVFITFVFVANILFWRKK